uniref:Uncharacterized protein n=1 Tax=Micrurus paraensis TaxID=1970185 RepID=A0A2D4KN14_9SAUR
MMNKLKKLLQHLNKHQPVEETNIQDEDPPVQQLENIEPSDLAKMPKEKIENHIKESIERKRLPTICEVHSKRVKDLLTAVNNILTSIPSSTLYETNQLMYSTSAVIIAELDYKMPKKETHWNTKVEIRFENK